MKIRYCSKCLFPETKPDLFFDDNGVCSACISADLKNKNIDWNQRERDFYSIIEHYRLPKEEIGYDCLIPCKWWKRQYLSSIFHERSLWSKSIVRLL